MALPRLLWMWLLVAGTQGELSPRNAQSGHLRGRCSAFCGADPSLRKI